MEDNKSQTQIKQKSKNPWLEHCRQVAQDNPNLTYKDVLKKARETYTKVQKAPKPVKEKVEKTQAKRRLRKSDSDSDSD